MTSIAIYTMTSELHSAEAVEAATREFLGSLSRHMNGGDVCPGHAAEGAIGPFDCRGDDFSDYGCHALDLIYVRTGGTEGIFKRLLPQLLQQSQRPLRLLTSGQSNSLAASMEMLAFLRQQGCQGEIIHGPATHIARRIALLARAGEALSRLRGCRLGIVGKPSDWLIASDVDRPMVSQRLGVELVDIAMQELLDTIASTPLRATHEEAPSKAIGDALPGAWQIYDALKTVVEHHELQGFTLRCFDLLTTVRNTGCLALARLNAEGIVAGCEGDVPAMLSMAVAQAAIGLSGFQANPARINPETGELLLAHCTIPLNMVERYDYGTHFESGIGVGIRGYMKEGPVTLFKLSGLLERCFIEEGELLRSQAEPGLCRTQQVVKLANADAANYFLNDPIGNHHIVLPGHHRELLEEIMPIRE